MEAGGPAVLVVLGLMQPSRLELLSPLWICPSSEAFLIYSSTAHGVLPMQAVVWVGLMQPVTWPPVNLLLLEQGSLVV